MNLFVKIFYTSFLILFLCVSADATIKVKGNIRVGVLCDVVDFTTASDKNYKIISEDGTLNLSAGKVKIHLAGKQIIIGQKIFHLPIKIKSPSFIVINNTWYRGSFIVTLSKNNKLNIINVVKIEDYIKGILAKEANSSWPAEALKVQAVISRSYVINSLNKHSKENFDVCAKVHCQVYGGASAENNTCTQAVTKTKGEVVMFKNKIAQTLFHSNCGGYTEDPKAVWTSFGTTPQYLKGVKDKYCKKAPNSKWTEYIPEETIRKKLIKAGHKVGEISSIKTSGNTTGHAKQYVIVKSTLGTLKLNAYTFRTTVDPWKIKSHMINSIKKKKKDFVFSGNGWGHKVGLCQWGAKGMADAKFNYKKILKFYYPQTTIGKVDYDYKQ